MDSLRAALELVSPSHQNRTPPKSSPHQPSTYTFTDDILLSKETPKIIEKKVSNNSNNNKVNFVFFFYFFKTNIHFVFLIFFL